MNNFAPLVSIVIPVYNGANYMAEAIDSALAQTYSNIEVLVINDGSKDNEATRNIALSYGNRIRYFEKENGGVATALNLGIAQMKGDFFSWLSHDDKYALEKIEKQVNFLSDSENKNIVLYSDLEYIDKNGNFISLHQLPHLSPDKFRAAFILNSMVSGCTLLVPKLCFEVCGNFDVTLRTTQDYDLWFRISEKYNFVHIPESLVYSRVHENQDTKKLRDTVVNERDNLHLNFIQRITKDEIKIFNNGNIAGYYIQFAFLMEITALLKAEKYALRKAFENLLTLNILRLLQNIFKLMFIFLVIGTRKTVATIFGYDTYLRLKRTIRVRFEFLLEKII